MGASKRGTCESAIHHQLDRVDKESSDARKSTALATSSGSPQRPAEPQKRRTSPTQRNLLRKQRRGARASKWVFKPEPSGFADSMQPAPRSRKKSLPDVGAFFASASIRVE